MESSNNTQGTVVQRRRLPYEGKIPGTTDVGFATAVCTATGMLFGGLKEAYASPVSKDAELVLNFGRTPSRREQLVRAIMESRSRSMRFARGSVKYGIYFGMFTATCHGLMNFFAEKRGVHDIYNAVGAGAATVGILSLFAPGSLRCRAINVLKGSAFGGAVTFPIGLVQLKAVEKYQGGTGTTGGNEGNGGVGVEVHFNK